jgi:hypothetical protein
MVYGQNKKEKDMKIKLTVWTLVFFMFIAVFDGFCFGGKDKATTDNTRDDAEITRLQNQIDQIKRDIDALQPGGENSSQQQGSKSDANINTSQNNRNTRSGIQDQSTPVTQDQRLVVDNEIIAIWLGAGINPRASDYYLSRTVVFKNERNSSTYRMENGRTIRNTPYLNLEISSEDKGRLTSNLRPDSNEIDVVFNNITIKFRKNSEENRFYIFSAKMRDIILNHDEGEIPYLVIELIENNIRYSGSPQNIAFTPPVANPQITTEPERSATNYSSLNTSNTSANTSGNRVPIMGSYSINRRAIVDYIRSYHRNQPISRNYDGQLSALIEHYVREAGIEGVNPYLAIAQMCYATDFLRNNELMAKRNYANLQPYRGFNGRFDRMEIGVRAHIQHLSLYATGRTSNPCIDPREPVLRSNGYLGRAQTLDELSRTWTPNNAQRYVETINRYINGLRQASNRT